MIESCYFKRLQLIYFVLYQGSHGRGCRYNAGAQKSFLQKLLSVHSHCILCSYLHSEFLNKVATINANYSLTHIIIGLAIFCIAVVYSSAGFGGGSLYLALLSQFGYSAGILRITSLTCNALVTANGTRSYALSGYMQWKQVLWLLVASVPACAFAATIQLNDRSYLVVLAVCLISSALLMGFQKKNQLENLQSVNKWWHYLASTAIGFLAGLTGIGGGVFLSPILHLSKWGSPKQIAAASSLFILVNSVMGVVVLWQNGPGYGGHFTLVLALCALAGSIVGSKLGTSILSQRSVKWVTIILLIFAAVRILVKQL